MSPPALPLPLSLRQRHRSLLSLVLVLVVFAIWFYRHFRVSPDYSALWDEEERVSDGWVREHEEVGVKGGKKGAGLVMFRQLRGAGFNNQIQETLLLSHLVTTHSSFTYVPPPITWQPRSSPHNLIPLSAFLTGLPPHPSEAHFMRACSEPKTVWWTPSGDGRVGEQLGELLTREEEKGTTCLVVAGERVVSWSWLETDSVLSLFPSYARGLLSKLTFSQRVLDATGKAIRDLSLDPSLDDVLAVHLRRGDFASHCPYLYKSQSAFTGWNRLLPAPAGLNATSEVSFMKHCYPTVEQMVATIEAHLSRLPMAASPPVRTLYVLHDFTHKPYLLPHLRSLELALLRSPRNTINRVRSSSDIHLPWQDRDLVVAVDMELGRRAAGGFIANGWSSLSGTIVGWRQMPGGKGEVGFW